MADIAILSTQSIRLLPYLKQYEESLQDISYDVIYWDRHGYRDISSGASTTHIFNYYHPSDHAKLHGIRGYIGFSRFANKVIKGNKYTKLIVLQVQTGVTIRKLLANSYVEKYILDIRDYSYESISLYRDYEKQLIQNSYSTAISSKGFKSFLPKFDYLVTHNISSPIPKALPRKPLGRPIVITYSGCIHYYEQNIRLIDLFGNDERFIFQFIGEGAEELEPYVAANKISNIVIRGAYLPDEEMNIYAQSDVISNAYGNNTPLLDYALANKLYRAIIHRKPILVSKGTYSAEVAVKLGIGFVVDFDDLAIKDKLISFLSNMEYSLIDKQCQNAISVIEQDNNLFLQTIAQFACNNLFVGHGYNAE